MLPRNRLRKIQMKRLFIFPDDKHPYGENILKDYEYDDENSLVHKVQDLLAQHEASNNKDLK